MVNVVGQNRLYTTWQHDETTCLVVKVPRSDDGLEALVFTAEGDMRQVGLGTWPFH